MNHSFFTYPIVCHDNLNRLYFCAYPMGTINLYRGRKYGVL